MRDKGGGIVQGLRSGPCDKTSMWSLGFWKAGVWDEMKTTGDLGCVRRRNGEHGVGFRKEPLVAKGKPT